MKKPPEWTVPEFEAEAAIARANFRSERLQEPLAIWQNTFKVYRGKFARLFDEYNAAEPGKITPHKLVDIFKNQLGEALRYMAGPPISEDDLETLAYTSLTPNTLKDNPEAARRVLDTIIQTIDPWRFPWIAENRPPRPDEKAAAILASAVLATSQRVATKRRNEGKSAQEKLVRAHLKSIGFTEVNPRAIRTLTDAPGLGEFCAECLVGTRKADIPVRLHDGRLMPIECKVSNSALNSVKRINNDAAVKARIWREEFGKNQAVPVAILSGVFKVSNLVQAQEGGLTIFWAHKLGDLTVFAS